MSNTKRLALVVGNSSYESAAPLQNAANDAVSMGKKLSELGFSVLGGTGTGTAGAPNVGIDLDRKTSVKRFAEFLDRIEPGDTAFVFYAGHGLQVADENFLVPVDASLAGDEPLTQLIRMRAMIEQAASRAGRDGTVIVFLDACRENPFTEEQLHNLARNARNLSAGQRAPLSMALVNKGFATMKMRAREDSASTFISFATAPGDVAYDGKGENSPFTLSVLDHIGTRGQELDEFINRVVTDVFDRSEQAGHFQEPWYESNLRKEFYFNPAGVAPILWLGLLSFIAGALMIYVLLEFKAFTDSVQGSASKASPLIYLTGLLIGGVMGYGVFQWGSRRLWHIVFVTIATALAFAFAVFILQTPIVQSQGKIPLLGNVPFSVDSILNRVRLQQFLANSRTVSLSVLVLLAGLMFTMITAACLKVQGGGFRGFGTLVGSMIVGVLLPFMIVAMLWWVEIAGAPARANINLLAIITVALWFMILGAQIGYSFMFHVPDHEPVFPDKS